MTSNECFHAGMEFAAVEMQFASQFASDAPHAQRTRMLAVLRDRGSLIPRQAREEMNIENPVLRAMELRESGERVTTVWTKTNTDLGPQYRVARFVMVGVAA